MSTVRSSEGEFHLGFLDDGGHHVLDEFSAQHEIIMIINISTNYLGYY